MAQRQHLLVQLIEIRRYRNGHPVIAPEIAGFAFDPALFMAGTGRAELARESPVRPESDEPGRFFPAESTENLLHSGRKIVIIMWRAALCVRGTQA